MLESRLTNPDTGKRDEELLRSYIKLEMKLVDVSFILVAISGAALAQFYIGWNYWTITKTGLYLTQFLITMAYLVKYIRPIVYPCSQQEYKRWYGIFGLAFSLFTITLVFTFFGK
jgi:putative membrane protein